MNPLIHQHHARRALGICNRLKPGSTKARHSGRILAAINRTRMEARQAEIIDQIEYASFLWCEQMAAFAKEIEALQENLQC